MQRHYSGWFIILILTCFLFAQVEKVGGQTDISLVRPVFPSTTQGNTSNYYGIMNGVHEVFISLQTLDQQYTGSVYYPESGIRLHIRGPVTGNTLSLTEYNYFGKPCGSFSGEIKGDTLIADWSNFDQSIGASIYCLKNLPDGLEQSFVRVEQFEGTYESRPLQLTIKHTPGRNSFTRKASASLYFHQKRTTLSGKGVFIPGQSATLSFINPIDESKGLYQGTIIDNDSISCTYKGPDGYHNFFGLNRVRQMDAVNLSYASYTAVFQVFYPQLPESPPFNAYIETTVQDWLDDAHYHLGQQVWNSRSGMPEHRLAHRLYVDFDLSYWSSNMISGMLHMTNTWTPDPILMPFNFDLTSQSPVTLDQLVDTDEEALRFIRQKVLRRLLEGPFGEEKEFFDWFRTQTLNHFTIRREGISFCTNFHPVFGRQSITITYGELNKFLKPDSPLKQLL